MSNLPTSPDGSDESSPKVEQFVKLLATCQRRVFLYALRLLHNGADAEEVLQETNLVLWRKFDQFEPGTDFVRWACRVAYFEVLKLREKRPSRERLFSGDFVEAIAVEAEESTELLDDRRQALTQCLQKLPQADRKLVLARYQPKATTRAVAESLERSVQGTQKSLHRIRNTLLVCIQRTLTAEERT